MTTPEDLRREAASAEALARTVSFRRDKDRLLAQAQALREKADRLEARSFAPRR